MLKWGENENNAHILGTRCSHHSYKPHRVREINCLDKPSLFVSYTLSFDSIGVWKSRWVLLEYWKPNGNEIFNIIGTLSISKK